LPADGTSAAAEVKGNFGKSRRQLFQLGYIIFAHERRGTLTAPAPSFPQLAVTGRMDVGQTMDDANHLI
jgi:hypothetical protein